MSNRGPVDELLARYSRAVYAKDVDAFVALYDTDARVFDMWGRWAYDGTTEWRQMAAEWFGSLGAEKVAVEVGGVQTVTAGDVAAAHAYLTFKGLSGDDQELRAMNNRLTWVLRKNPEGEWKVIHEHTSAPADFDTGKVMLHRGGGASD
jgi:uncharacterized protein (TIGR02246 family)